MKTLELIQLRRKLRAARAGFTLIELLVVIGIIAILASLLVGSAGIAGRWSKERNVRAGLQELVTAIQAYNLAIGSYPPDTPGAPTDNALYYELVGTYSGNGMSYTTLDGRDTIANPSAAWAASFPSIGGILNSAPTAAQGRTFLPALSAKKHVANAASVQFLVAPVDGTNAANSKFNPWRYVSTNPTNNPKSFDLWAEVVIGGKVRVIGNWK